MKKTIAIAVVVGSALAAPSAASAFCGFYVGSAGETLYNDATQVVLMRSGTRTVLSMQQSYKGPPADFAMVVPVPVVLKKEQVKTLPREVFEQVDKLDAPRLVEYWEEDPCPTHAPPGDVNFGFGSGSGSGFGTIGSAGMRGRTSTVKVEAKFTVGEYNIVILSATDALGLEEWLAEHEYKIPPGAAPYLKPYVESGSKFFVAKVDVDKVKMVDGRAMLSPLRFHYDAETFALPIRLGLANSGGVQDLIVHILGSTRYEVANYPNVMIPTNLVVKDAARARFGEFYAALFDRTLEENKGAVVTEYAWGSSTCDPCPVSPLSENDTATLGGDVLGFVAAGNPAPLKQPTVTGGKLDAAIIRRYMRRMMPRMASCGAGAQPFVVEFDILADGSTAKVKVSGVVGTGATSCVEKAVDDIVLPKPQGGAAHVKYPLSLAGVGGGRGGLILTRLHARYSADTIGEDLVFREAAPVVGGRGIPDSRGVLPEEEQPSGVPQFQARYVILNPWTGPIGCAAPQRGNWGGPPADKDDRPVPAIGLAEAKRGGIDLTAMIADVVASAPPPAAAGGTATPPPAEKPRRPKRAEGCAAGGGGGGASAALLLVVAALLARRRRAGFLSIACAASACASAHAPALAPAAPQAGVAPRTAAVDPATHEVRVVEVASGVSLEVLDHGGTGDAMVFLTGLGNTAHVFDELAPRFIARHRAVAITRRGYGGSSGPEIGYDAPTRVADIIAVLDQLDIARAVVLGHSVASEEMTLMAGTHPDRVIALVYIDAAFDQVDVSALHTELPPPRPAGAPPPTTTFASAAVASDYLRAEIGIAMPFGEVLASYRIAGDGRVVGERGRPDANAKMIEGLRGSDCTRVRCPALVLYAIPSSPERLLGANWGKLTAEEQAKWHEVFPRFVAFQRQQQAKVVAQLRGAQVVEYPDANHYVFLDRPDDVVRDIDRFLAAIEPRGQQSSSKASP